jgi:hypothetical protein
MDGVAFSFGIVDFLLLVLVGVMTHRVLEGIFLGIISSVWLYCIIYRDRKKESVKRLSH